MHKFKYGRKEYHIPERMMGGIQRYINNHIRPGNFLCSIICNNLKNSIAYADEENMKNIPAFVDYFYNNAPHNCWGSEKKMEAWLKLGLKPK